MSPKQTKQHGDQEERMDEDRGADERQENDAQEGEPNAFGQPQPGQAEQHEEHKQATSEDQSEGERQAASTTNWDSDAAGERNQNRERAQREPAGRGDGSHSRRERGAEHQLSRRSARRAEPGELFTPRGATSVGLLRLARNWQHSGATYQAIHVYTQILDQYSDTGAANAAIEEMLDLAETLQQEGRFLTALGIFRTLEQYQ